MQKHKIFSILTLLFFIPYTPIFCEDSNESEANTTIEETASIATNTEDSKKHYFIALGGAILANGGIFVWNKYMIRAGWTKVTIADMEYFWQKRQSWDCDWYWTNFVLHPYQGSLSYMTARAANLNRIESLALAVGASYAWEFLCETNEPSKNDLIYTPIGSFPVGEMLYRLSLEADSVSRLLGYAINPMRLYTDLATGHKPRGITGNITSLSAKLSFGTMPTYSHFDLQGETKYKHVIFPAFCIPEINVVYGNPYGTQTHDPFSSFDLRVGGGAGYNATENEAMYDIHIFSHGLLWTFAPVFNDYTDTTIGLGYDYDFIWHSFMELTSIAPGFCIKQRITKKAIYEWQFHLGWNILGTSDYIYYFYDYERPGGIYREYSFNTGIEGVLQWRRTSLHDFIIDTSLHYYGFYDFYNQKQSTAWTGWEDVGILELSLEMPVTKQVGLGIGNELYGKRAYYHNENKVYQIAYKGMVYMRLKAK